MLATDMASFDSQFQYENSVRDSNRNNPYYDPVNNSFPTFANLQAGVQFNNETAHGQKLFAYNPGSAPGIPNVANANGIGARSPFPTLASAWSNLVQSHTAGQDALHNNFQKYLSAVGKTNDASQTRLPAEQGIVQSAMDNTQGTLDQFTNDQAARVGAVNDQAKTELTGQASDLASKLQTSRDDFSAQLTAEIGKLSSGLKDNRNAAYNSSLQASDLASASARADAASRGAIQPFDLTKNEAIGTANRIGAQNQFYGQERSDLGTISGLRQNQIAASTSLGRQDIQSLADLSRSNTMFNTGRADQLNQVLAQHATNFQQAQALKLSLLGKQQQLADQVNQGLLTPVNAQMEYEQHLGQLINGLASAYPGQVYTDDSGRAISNFGAGLGTGRAITPTYQPIAPQQTQPASWQDYLSQFPSQVQPGAMGVPQGNYPLPAGYSPDLSGVVPGFVSPQTLNTLQQYSSGALVDPGNAGYQDKLANLRATGGYDYAGTSNYNSTGGEF